jgi:phosphomannomutase
MDDRRRSFNVAALEQSNGFTLLGGPPPDDRSLGDHGHVRDKDGTFAAVLMAELAQYAKEHGLHLLDLLDEKIYLDPDIGLYITHYEPDPMDGEYEGLAGYTKKRAILQAAEQLFAAVATEPRSHEGTEGNGETSKRQNVETKVEKSKSQKVETNVGRVPPADLPSSLVRAPSPVALTSVASSLPPSIDNRQSTIDNLSASEVPRLGGLPVVGATVYRTGKYDAVNWPGFPDEGFRFYFDAERRSHLTIRPSGTSNALRFHVQLFGGCPTRAQLIAEKARLRATAAAIVADIRRLIGATR